MEVVVLAGGFGTRLKSVVTDVPKPMAPINGKPFLEYLLQYLISNNVKHVVLSVGYKSEIIQNYFRDSYKNITITYSIEGKPLGTGGAIKKAIKYIKGDQFYILNGDTFFNISLNAIKLERSTFIKIALKHVYNTTRYGFVVLDNKGKISKFLKKSNKSFGKINAGIYLTRVNLFDNYKLSESFSFEKFLEENIKNLHAFGKVFDNYFIDIGVPEDYDKANKELVNYIS